MANEELIQYITHGREERNLEYKGPINWNDTQIKAKITKTILAMSNLRDGGVIVIGVEQNGEIFTPVGLDSESISSFKQDDISVHVNNYADPFVEIKVSYKIAEKDFNEKYMNAFAEGYKLCYCYMVCPDMNECKIKESEEMYRNKLHERYGENGK